MAGLYCTHKTTTNMRRIHGWVPMALLLLLLVQDTMARGRGGGRGRWCSCYNQTRSDYSGDPIKRTPLTMIAVSLVGVAAFAVGALVASTQLRCDSNSNNSSNNKNSSSNNNKHSGAHGVVIMAQLPLSSQQQASQSKLLGVHSTSNTTTTRTDRSTETRFMPTNETKGNHKGLMLNGVVFKSTMMEAAVQANLRKNHYNARTDTSSDNHSYNPPPTPGMVDV